MAEVVGPRLYSCCNCRNHVALHDDVISKAFQGRHSRAFLFSHVMNVMEGPKEDRELMTGLHTVADIYCCDCREVLGWKYQRAYEETEKYKEGKFILEKSKIARKIGSNQGCLVFFPVAVIVEVIHTSIVSRPSSSIENLLLLFLDVCSLLFIVCIWIENKL